MTMAVWSLSLTFVSLLVGRSVQLDPHRGGCPPTPYPKTAYECAGRKSECWSPGVPDLDCPGSAYCCFDGCANVCQPAKETSPVYSAPAQVKSKPFTAFKRTEPAYAAPSDYGVPRTAQPKLDKCPKVGQKSSYECRLSPSDSKACSSSVDCGYGHCCFDGCSNICVNSKQKTHIEPHKKPKSPIYKVEPKLKIPTSYQVTIAGGGKQCPKIEARSAHECKQLEYIGARNLEATIKCWSPGRADLDCPDSGLCCFNGCENTCISQPVELPKRVYGSPVPKQVVPSYPAAYTAPLVQLPPTLSKCPYVAAKSPYECQGLSQLSSGSSKCWSPGQPDVDCPQHGICCFNGCSNVCLDEPLQYQPIESKQQRQYPCQPSPCGPNTECTSDLQTGVDYGGSQTLIAKCECLPGYQTKTTAIDGCHPECETDYDCTNPIRPKCDVSQSPARCIERPDPCQSRPCGPGTTCTPVGVSAVCNCLPGLVPNPDTVTGCIEECKSDYDCHSFHGPNFVCSHERTCEANPCQPSPCGFDAECHVHDGHPICKCLDGWIPSPTALVGCTKPECQFDYDCHGDSSVCKHYKCVDLCASVHCAYGAKCAVDSYDHSASCQCLPGLFPKPTAKQGCGPECQTDYDCKNGQFCSNSKCVSSPCKPNPCGMMADCAVKRRASSFGAYHDHALQYECSCQAGSFGDPYAGCMEGECQDNHDCSSDKACISYYCLDPCYATSTNSSSASVGNAPRLSVCGYGYQCRAKDHSPVCGVARKKQRYTAPTYHVAKHPTHHREVEKAVYTTASRHHHATKVPTSLPSEYYVSNDEPVQKHHVENQASRIYATYAHPPITYHGVRSHEEEHAIGGGEYKISDLKHHHHHHHPHQSGAKVEPIAVTFVDDSDLVKAKYASKHSHSV